MHEVALLPKLTPEHLRYLRLAAYQVAVRKGLREPWPEHDFNNNLNQYQRIYLETKRMEALLRKARHDLANNATQCTAG